MAPLTSLTDITKLPEKTLDGLIRRIGLVLVVGAVLFTAFYLFDRWRPASAPIADQRLAALEEAVRADPADIASRGQLADLYVAKSRFEDAIVQYTAILDAGQDQELAHMGRAGAYLSLERYDDARTDFLAVVEIAAGGEMANVDPMLEAAYYNLGLIAMKQGDPATAVTYLEDALRIKRSDADALYLIGTAYTATGATERAEIALRRAVAYVPIGWPEPYAALAATYAAAGRTAMAEWATVMADIAAGDTSTAEARLLALVEGEAALDATIGLGLYYESTGDSASAAAWYTKAVAIDPENDAAILGLGRVGPIPQASTGSDQ